MNVFAFSTPSDPDEWRWRIINYSGETLEESGLTFPTITTALVAGRHRLAQIDTPDRSTPRPTSRSTSFLRYR